MLAALPLLGGSVTPMAQGTTPAGSGPQVTVLMGGYPVTPGTAVDWTVHPTSTVGLIGSIEEVEPTAVVMLPLTHTTMTVDDWLVLGVDPIVAAQRIACLQPGESLSALLDLDGQVLWVVVTSQGDGAAASSTFVVTAPPQNAPETLEELIERLRRMLRELHDTFLPPPPPAGDPGDQDPNGDL